MNSSTTAMNVCATSHATPTPVSPYRSRSTTESPITLTAIAAVTTTTARIRRWTRATLRKVVITTFGIAERTSSGSTIDAPRT